MRLERATCSRDLLEHSVATLLKSLPCAMMALKNIVFSTSVHAILLVDIGALLVALGNSGRVPCCAAARAPVASALAGGLVRRRLLEPLVDAAARPVSAMAASAPSIDRNYRLCKGIFGVFTSSQDLNHVRDGLQAAVEW